MTVYPKDIYEIIFKHLKLLGAYAERDHDADEEKRYANINLDSDDRNGSFISVSKNNILFFRANSWDASTIPLTPENAQSLPYELKYLGYI